MKTLFAAIFVAFTVGTSSPSFASAAGTTGNGHETQATSDPVAFVIDNSKVDVIIKATDTPKMIIRMKDSSGNTIAIKTLSHVESGTRVRFDLSQLSDGLYSVRVWDGKNVQEQEIKLKTTSPDIAIQKVSFL
ncbi:hypothetical protein GCM10023188_13740 [Pontibacter saemangeumensis]|uniref:Por secretion system C-terminal sorting domain-containing protein n=1 Tax=Pontibacter saemangeumensis TaxID=1084525 RepID=A0ABP8LIH1_9BACT